MLAGGGQKGNTAGRRRATDEVSGRYSGIYGWMCKLERSRCPAVGQPAVACSVALPQIERLLRCGQRRRLVTAVVSTCTLRELLLSLTLDC